MGVLRSESTNTALALAPRNLIGRGPECGIRLEDRSASATHAALTFKDDGWLLRDLGSRNGTFVDDVPLAPRQPVVVRPGARLRFGKTAVFVVVDVGGPGIVGLDPTRGEVRQARGGLLVLPHDDAPEAVLYDDGQGGWTLERGHDVEAIEASTDLELDSGAWRILVPARHQEAELPTTWDLSATEALEGVGLTLSVSQDEEHIDVALRRGGETLPLRSRVHHHLLLQLARARVADAEQGLKPSEVGWVYTEDLCKQLQITPGVLSLHMLRARQQLGDAGVEGVGRLFARRSLSGQLRLDLVDVEVQSA